MKSWLSEWWRVVAFLPEIVHQPVMLEETLEMLALKPGGTYVDCTLGAGGHTGAILERIGEEGRVIGFDRDREALARSMEALARYNGQVTYVNRNFRHLAVVLGELGLTRVDGILFDLGVSSFQVLDPERGFSYMHDAPLDMRMDEKTPTTAADLVNNLEERELSRLIFAYGEEKWARRIASFIVERRRNGPIATTGELVEVIKAAIPAGARRSGPHPAKRTFQALRIAVNDELGAVAEGVRAAASFVGGGGRLVVISFHSLEDRLVKQTFRELASDCICPDPGNCTCGRGKIGIITRKPLTPGQAEVARNPRARSAKLRVAEGR